MVIGYYTGMNAKEGAGEYSMQVIISAAAEGVDPARITAQLEELGHVATPNLVRCLIDVAQKLATGADSVQQLAVFIRELLMSPHPEGALLNFLRFVEASGASATFLNTVAGGRPIREILATLFGSSQYMSDIVTRNPGYLYWLIEKQTWDREETPGSFEEQLAADVDNFRTVESKLNAVRRFQRRMLLKIGVKDLLGLATIEDTTMGLSSLADAILRGVLDIVWRDLARVDAPSVGSGFTVIALGKLGGNELNYSSDIDLIYICNDASDPAIDFYNKLARRLTSVLSAVTAEGYLYRVDLRLRPDGDVGPLVSPLTSLRIYYEDRGRPWEFQAMLKARVVAGDRSAGEEFLTHIAGLVFNPTLSYSPLEAISLMRLRIRESMSPHDRTFNIKLMEGGIRDIEFIVQTLQLMYGSRHPDLRTPNTLEGIRLAHRHKLIRDLELETMMAAYRFLRLVEHRLQMMHQIKTHSIPSAAEETRLLSRRVSRGPMGTFGYEDFLSTLTTHINNVRVLSDSFFAGEAIPESSMLLLLPEDDEFASNILSKYGLSSGKTAFSVIRSLAYGTFPALVDRKTRGSFQRLLPLVLEEISSSGDPDMALINFSKIAAASKNVSTFYDFLYDSPASRALVCVMAATSTTMTARLCNHVEIFDTILEDPKELLSGRVGERMDWRVAVNDSARRDKIGRELRSEIDRRLVASWVRDTREGTFPGLLKETITASIHQTVSSAFDSLIEDDEGIALLALGSLAIGEPRPESDVDLLVVTKDRDIEPVTRSIQRMGRLLGEGGIVKVDFRLRGEGQNAPLVQDLEYYRSYFTKRMSPWEMIAFAKCSHWRGDPGLAQEFIDELLQHLTRSFDDKAMEALRRTRYRLESLVPQGGVLLETKRSPGGRYDIEYLTSVGMQSLGRPYALSTNTERRLEMLASESFLSHRELEILQSAHRFYLSLEYLLELWGASLPTTPKKIRRVLRHIDRSWSMVGLPAIAADTETMLRSLKQAVRNCYQRVMVSGDAP